MGFDRARLKRLIEEQDSLDGMRSAFHTIEERQKENLPLIRDIESRKERLRQIKKDCIGNDALFELAKRNLEHNGFRVEIASDDQKAVEILLREIGSERLVVKSKSNITKEIQLTHRLEEKGIEVVETDLGDRIIQISGLEPVHPTGPAAHLSRYKVAEILSKHFKRQLPPDPDVLAETVRQELDGYLCKAKIGITGANAIATLEGAAVIVHNEGNVTRCSQAQKKHIIVTTRDKIVPNLDEAINQVKLQTFYATGKLVSAHIDIISSPSYTADIEKKIFKGMHGPKDILIVFVDSGRSEIGHSEILYCISCGNCLLGCPVYDVAGPAFGAKGHPGGIGVSLTAKRGEVSEADEHGLYLCLACGACQTRCPASIDIRPEIIDVRGKDTERRTDEQKAAVSSISNYDNPWMQPRNMRSRWAKDLDMPAKGEILYFPGCSLSLLHPEIARKTVELLRASGLNPSYLGQKEPCCGSILRKLGDQKAFERQVSKLIGSIKDSGAKKVIVSCPGCMQALTIGKEFAGAKSLEIRHISQELEPVKGKARKGGKTKVTYHDPCELGRGLGIISQPRELISSLEGVELVEMEKSKSDSACCGAGSGVRSGYPELSNAIATKRIASAEGTGADVLLTCCPWCLENLSENAKNRKIKVQDLVDFIGERD